MLGVWVVLPSWVVAVSPPLVAVVVVVADTGYSRTMEVAVGIHSRSLDSRRVDTLVEVEVA